jgi:hypothetical protein
MWVGRTRWVSIIMLRHLTPALSDRDRQRLTPLCHPFLIFSWLIDLVLRWILNIKSQEIAGKPEQC